MKVYTDAEFYAMPPETQEMLRRNGWSASAPSEPASPAGSLVLATGSPALAGVWVVTSGNWGAIDSAWATREAAWKRAEQLPTNDGYINCPSYYLLGQENAEVCHGAPEPKLKT